MLDDLARLNEPCKPPPISASPEELVEMAILHSSKIKAENILAINASWADARGRSARESGSVEAAVSQHRATMRITTAPLPTSAPASLHRRNAAVCGRDYDNSREFFPT